MGSMDERILTRNLRRYDANLYAKRNSKGTMCIWCNHKRYEPFTYKKGVSLKVLKVDPYLVMALTDTWSVSGKPVEWGIDVVINRLKAQDILKNPNIFKDMDELDEKVEESKQRDMSNTIESFLYDFRSQFKKTFNDINISSLKK